MKQDRFLMAILAGIGILVVISLTIFLVRRQQITYLPEDTPSAVVHNYVVALQSGDFERAHGYLADADGRPSLQAFRDVFLMKQLQPGQASLKLGETFISGEQATVQLTVIQGDSGLMGSSYRQNDRATLEQQNGVWKIRYLPYPYFNWDWFQEDFKK